MTLVFPDRNPFLTAVQFADPQAALNHAMELHRLGRLGEAETLYRQLLVHFPDSTDILHLLGLIEVDTNRDAEGFAKLAEAVRRSPQTPHYHANHGVRLLDRRRTGEAETCLREAIRLQPDHPTHHYNLGNALLPQGRHAEAVASFRNSLRLHPENPDAELQLGVALHAGGQRAEARAWYREVLTRRPGHFSIATNLGALLQEDCDLDGAAASFRHAIQANPTHPVPLNNLAVIHKELGDAAEAVRLLRRCADIDPTSASMLSNLILIMHYDPGTTDAALRAEHARWNERFVPRKRQDHANSPDPRRRLKIGFVSADFRDHVVGRALLPSFVRHDRSAFAVYGYSASGLDALGQVFRDHADGWRDIRGVPAETVAEWIREDGIDILVDLSLHTSDNRLDVFALKPAPIQAAWLGYPESSGLETIDYRLTDRWLEPTEGNTVCGPQEKAWLLPDCWTCYEPPSGYPEVNVLPAATRQNITFGSFNNTCKINGMVLDAWARLMSAVPGSSLKLLAKHGAHRSRLRDEFARRGVAADRIVFEDYLPAEPGLSQGALLARYHGIDIALDTFPYGGMTTTLDALWMGVPVVSLVGERNLGRAGLSLLSNVGLTELATADIGGYVAAAVRLARDRPGLAALRASLRARMQASPLLDAVGYTRKVEQAFRDMWVDWCAGQPKVG